ncbi:MAG: DNA polymerase [Pseudomonadota bacterium]
MSLQSLYVDLNSFFASVEQQLRPELRGRPIGVLPVMADTTCCIAASIDAKRFGIRTGTPVWQARKLCRDIVFVQARPSIYVDIHHRIIAAVESCTPVGEVLSIDEMACELMGSDREEANAIKRGKQIKQAIYDQVGDMLHSSIGIAPNRFLAKTASNMQKPDGLVVIRQNELPGRLYGLKLGALTGIGRAMEHRLNQLGIHTVEQLCTASKETLRHAWGGIEGERFHAKLRGDATAAAPTQRASIGHSHVLAPELRDPASALAVLKRLLHKAAMRLRHYGYCAGALSLHLQYMKNRHRPSPLGRSGALLAARRYLQVQPRAGRTMAAPPIRPRPHSQGRRHPVRPRRTQPGHTRPVRPRRPARTPQQRTRPDQPALRPQHPLFRRRPQQPRRRADAHRLQPRPRIAGGK